MKVMVSESDFVKEIDGMLKRVMKDKAMRDDVTNYVLRITHKEIKTGLNRQRITTTIMDAVKTTFEHIGYEVELEEESIKLTAFNVFAKKSCYTFDDLMLQHEIIAAKKTTTN